MKKNNNMIEIQPNFNYIEFYTRLSENLLEYKDNRP